MPRKLANYETDCGECYTYIAQDDPIWFGEDGQKLCRDCATKQQRICPQCDGSKKPPFEMCWDCKEKERGPGRFRKMV
jgi:hypothetical protein